MCKKPEHGSRQRRSFYRALFALVQLATLAAPFWVMECRVLAAGPTRSEADTKPGDAVGASFRDCADCPEMVTVPPGEFMMGSSTSEFGSYDAERPRHRVVVSAAFAIGKYHVTREEYARFVKATNYPDGLGCYTWTGSVFDTDQTKSWREPGFAQTERDPVVCENWYDAKAYVAWLTQSTGKSYRLLTEAEWEYVARAGTTTTRYWGDSTAEQCRYANGADLSAKDQFPDWPAAPCRDGYVFTSPAGNFEGNAFGLFDILGNVWNWTEDCWNDNYEDAPSDASIARETGDCSRRVIRGGAYSRPPTELRSGVRGRYGSIGRVGNSGFRVARDQ
jgi:formylglycine-generating enzyme required for sulfatase activity